MASDSRPPERDTHPPEDDRRPPDLVDFTPIPRRLQTGIAIIAALSLAGCVVDGALHGLTFALMARWAGIFVVAALFVGAAITALHALGGADRAGRRGERLAGPDVGIAPRRLESVPESDAQDGDTHGSAPEFFEGDQRGDGDRDPTDRERGRLDGEATPGEGFGPGGP